MDESNEPLVMNNPTKTVGMKITDAIVIEIIPLIKEKAMIASFLSFSGILFLFCLIFYHFGGTS